MRTYFQKPWVMRSKSASSSRMKSDAQKPEMSQRPPASRGFRLAAQAKSAAQMRRNVSWMFSTQDSIAIGCAKLK